MQERIPTWEAPVIDPLTGRFVTTHIDNQDFVAWAGQGRISDRTKEHLGPSDRGIILMRKRFFDDLARIERGDDPSGLIRDPAKNVRIELPIADRAYLTGGKTLAEMLADPFTDPRQFITIAGQPKYVTNEVMAACGLDENGQALEDVAADRVFAAVGTGQKSQAWWS